MVVHLQILRREGLPVPRITEQRREGRRTEILAAARSCFSRQGFHQTSMPDIAAEAGVSTGAPYRYFSSKEEIVLEIAVEAFRLIFEPVERLIDSADAPTVAEIVEASVGSISDAASRKTGDHTAATEELLRCAVHAWGELLRHDGLHRRAVIGFDYIRQRVTEALRRGQQAGSVTASMDPERASRIVMALLHGFVLQHTAFGLVDPQGFTQEVRALLTDAGVLKQAAPGTWVSRAETMRRTMPERPE